MLPNKTRILCSKKKVQPASCKGSIVYNVQDMRLIMGDSCFNRFKVTSKVLSKMELSKACEFVELQMLLPRRYCVDTQVHSFMFTIRHHFLHQLVHLYSRRSPSKILDVFFLPNHLSGHLQGLLGFFESGSRPSCIQTSPLLL